MNVAASIITPKAMAPNPAASGLLVIAFRPSVYIVKPPSDYLVVMRLWRSTGLVFGRADDPGGRRCGSANAET
jgi:hypothetical protein